MKNLQRYKILFQKYLIFFMITFLRTTELSVIFVFVFLEKPMFRTNCNVFIFRVVLSLEFLVEWRCRSTGKLFIRLCCRRLWIIGEPNLTVAFFEYETSALQKFVVEPTQTDHRFVEYFRFFCRPFGFVVTSLSLRCPHLETFDHCHTVLVRRKRHSFHSTMKRIARPFYDV